MTTKVQVGTIFIENRPLIMRPLNLESEPYSGNWGVLASLTSFGLSEKVRGAGWTCVPLAGEMKATVFGSLAAPSIRRALKQIFLEVRNLDFNCLEITKIVEGRFLGMAPVFGQVQGIFSKAPSCRWWMNIRTPSVLQHKSN